MKTITDVVKLLGQERHDDIDMLSKDVFEKCQELNILKTKAGHDITIEIVNRIVRNTLSNIKYGRGRWLGWSYRLGKGYLKLYDTTTMDIIKLSNNSLEAFEYVDSPQIKVRVEPKKEGLDAKPFYQTCKTFQEARDYVKRASFTSGIFLSIGKMLIPLDDCNMIEKYK